MSHTISLCVVTKEIEDTCQVIVFVQRGDADNSGILNVSDVTYLVAFIFGGGPAPIPELLEQKGVGTIIFSMAEGDVPEFSGYAWDSFFTTRKFMEKHPEKILAFTKAIIQAIEYIHMDKAGTMEIIAKTWKEATPELREASYQSIAKAVPREPFLTEAGWDINMKLHFADATADEIKKMSYAKTATNKFVEQALKELGK